MCAPRSAEGGFSLLEAVVALAIVAVVSVAALSSLGAELRAAARARDTLPASLLAEHRLAVLHLLPAEGLAHLPDSVARGRFEEPFRDYAWRADAEPLPGQPGLYEVEVEVSWPDGSYVLRSRLYRPERRLAPEP
jgi:type II secretion system protein I